DSSSSFLGEQPAHDPRDALPLLDFGREVSTASARELVELRAPLVVALAPMRGDPPPLLETHEGRINRALIETQQVVRHLLDPPRDPIAVRGAQRVERLQHHDVEGSLHHIRFRVLVHEGFLLNLNMYSSQMW